MQIILTGDDLDAAEAAMQAVLADLGVADPARAVERIESQRKDPATAIALASLILSIPGVVLATLQVKEHFDRRRLAATITHLKTELDRSDTEAELRLGSGAPVDLRRTATDRVVDLPIRDLSGGKDAR